MNKAKYILRGFGAGIVITAVLMGIYTRQAVADARVKVLKEYGIGEEATLVDAELIPFGDGTPPQTTELNSESETETAESAAETTAAAEPETTAEPEPESKPEAETKTTPETQTQTNTQTEAKQESKPETPPQPKPEAESAAKPSESAAESKSAAEPESKTEANTKTENNKEITIVIVHGDDSGTVSRKLHNAGLVANAAEFDAFLMQHGYDKRINTGTKTLKSGDSWQKIAEKITK